MNLKLEYWTPKIIGYVNNPNHKNIQKKLIKDCLKISKKIKKGGNNWVSNKTYNTLGTYNIFSDVNFKDITTWVNQQVIEYAKQLKCNSNLKCVDSWINIYKKNDYQEFHIHPSHTLSAVYYVKSNPNKSSKLIFRLEEQRHSNELKPLEINNLTSESAYYPAIPGMLIIFKSNMYHCVEKSNEEKDRISLAFNFSY